MAGSKRQLTVQVSVLGFEAGDVEILASFATSQGAEGAGQRFAVFGFALNELDYVGI